MIRVDRHPSGPRLYVAGKRLHHGSAGLIALSLAIPLRRRRWTAAAVTLGAIAAVVHDLSDFPWTDAHNH